MKTKRLFARITCILLLTLLFTPLFAVNSNAEWQYAEDMNWARTADLQEVKNKLKDLQGYLLPLDRHDIFFYNASKTHGGGTNQGNANGYTNRFTYDIITSVENVEGVSWPVTHTRVDLNLPELPVIDSNVKTVFYHALTLNGDYEWNEIDDYSTAEHPITSVGGYPAKGYWNKKNIGYDMELYVNLVDLFPWAQDNRWGSCLVKFSISSFGGESADIAESIGNTIMSWQPSISEPVVICAETDPDVLKELGIKKGDYNVVTSASVESGEDGGVSVPAVVVTGVLGGGAAIAGAAAASGGSDSKKKKQKAYKMYVQKDFGDAIRRGGEKPVKIRARMAEVDESGAEHDRNDLTSQIGVSADGMTVHGAALAGRYCEATVSVPENNQNDTASITFSYIGEGGSFTNTVIFRIVDGSSLKFVEETEKAGAYRLNTGVAYIDAIPGDGFTYTEQFMIVDAPVAPALKDITAVNTGEFDVKFELTDRQAVYKMTVKNNTKPEPEHDIFAKEKEEKFEIHVTVEGEKEPVKGYVTVKLYPEGITVKSRDEGKKNDVKYVRVQAYEKEHVGDLDRKWQVSQIIFTLAVIGKDKAIIDPGEAKYKFEKLKGAGGLGMRADKEQNLAEKYEYKEEYGEMNGKFTYVFEPNANLAEPDDGTFMMVILPVSSQYDGRIYKAEIPLRLRGKDSDPMADWEKEYKELCRRVEKFSLPQNKDKWLKQVKECAVDPKVSVAELRLVSKWILREYMAYWTTQQSRDQSEAAWCNVIVNTLEWTKFAGDCAFSLLVTMYAGPVAEALISPAKDFITGAIGEVIAARNFGVEIDVDKFEFSKNLAAAGDNIVSNSIDLKDWRKAAATLSGYFVYCAIKNYLLKLRKENESDLWGALCEGFKDMTAAALKSKGGELIGKWIKDSKKFQEKIAPFIVKYFKETNMTTLQHRLNDALGVEKARRILEVFANDDEVTAKIVDVVDKYVTELVGEGCSKVRDAYDSSTFSLNGSHVMFSFTLDLFDAFHFGVTLDLTKILMGTTCPLFSWFYDLFFAGIPAASSVIDTPKDPPLPPAKD